MINFPNPKDRKYFIHFFLFLHAMLIFFLPPTLQKFTLYCGKISINEAGMEEINIIPGIGTTRTQIIYDHIRKKGTIRNQKELEEIKGIGKKCAQKIVGYISFDTAYVNDFD